MLRHPDDQDDPVSPYVRILGIAIWIFLLCLLVLECLYLYDLFMWRIGL